MAIQKQIRRTVGIRINEDAAQILNQAAEKEGRGLGNYIARIAEAHANKIEKRK